jgi:chemotaxis protein methyltransferase CheR
VSAEAQRMNPAGRAREFEFSEDDFMSLRDLVKNMTGITLATSKSEMVYGRLSRRLRALNLKSFRDYRTLLSRAEGQQELAEFVNALTTNLTSFFRESHHFEYLREHLLKPLAAKPRRLRMWSAGCSTGEEPYSIAITVAEALGAGGHGDLRILATDLDSEVLERGKAGHYREDRLRGMAPGRRDRFFSQFEAADGPQYAVSPDLAAMITFRQLNLMHELPMKGPLDAIFCRNVVIYFDKDTQRQLFARFAKVQRPGDLLFLGHSESLHNVSDAYSLIGKTVYRRNAS